MSVVNSLLGLSIIYCCSLYLQSVLCRILSMWDVGSSTQFGWTLFERKWRG